jgi:hypothetical protein
LLNLRFSYVPINLSSAESITSQKCTYSQAWWYTSVIPALQRLRQEDGEFEAGLRYAARHGFRKQKYKTKQKKFTLMLLN